MYKDKSRAVLSGPADRQPQEKHIILIDEIPDGTNIEIPSQYVTSHKSQLSLAIPPWESSESLT